MSTNVTDKQIQALRAAAGQAGDLLQVAICDRALGEDDSASRIHEAATIDSGDRAKLRDMDREAAVAECARVIAEAEAQQ